MTPTPDNGTPIPETGVISLVYEREEVKSSVELIMDASWSMTLPTDSDLEADRLTVDDPNSRIRIAKDSLIELIDQGLPNGTSIAYRAFGADEGGPAACNVAGDLYIPFSPLDREELIAQIEATDPQFNADTPLAASLRQVPIDMASVTSEIIVVLVTDGEERCNGNVDDAIASLDEHDVDISLNIIGFAIADEDVRSQFEEWAELDFVTYYDAGNVEGLNQALIEAFPNSFSVVDGNGETIMSGVIGGAQVEVPVGTYTVVAGGVIFENVTISADEEVILEIR